jgi:hypothetical protein
MGCLLRLAPRAFFLFFALGTPALLRAQECALVPVPLSQRTQQAKLVVEARVSSQEVLELGGHIVTRNTLEVFKLFRGHLPAGPLRVLTAGGTLGQRREEVSSSLQLAEGQQGVFFLEADPSQPGELRAYAGPQGFVDYDLASLTAHEPFGRYASITSSLYAAIEASAGATYQEVKANAKLAAATQRRSLRAAVAPLATTAPTIDSFSPQAVTAGTSTTTTTSPDGVLTITGAGFGATQGAGYVQFRNADDGGASYTKPQASDYLTWSDTQIQVRVPSRSASGHPAGTGTFQVADNNGTLATSASTLTVTYAIINTVSNGQNYRAHLISPDNSGGYTLQYAASFPTEAKAPFERSLQNWRCPVGISRTISATAAVDDVTKQDNVNVVRFDPTLAAGVLGVTYSYSSGCSSSSTGPLNWQVVETDYAYTPVPIPATSTAAAYTWNYATTNPTIRQYDFESVTLHELGHGAQLTHIISSTGVMNYALPNGQTRRVLDTNTDIVAGKNVRDYSTKATITERCSRSAFVATQCPLPVQLTAFAARYQPSQGTLLSWATASESNSSAFVVESQDEPATGTWQAVASVAAAGTSATSRQYQARDARPLAGTRYYRLRQVDLDGREAFSPVVSVAAPATELAAYPNPATGTVHLSGPLASGATARVHLLDATGRRVASLVGPAGQAAFDLPLARVPAGLYLLEWDGGAGIARTRLVVQ